MKNVMSLFIALCLVACGNETTGVEQIQLNGYAQGTTFQIKYLADPAVDMSGAVDSLLRAVNRSMSTYDSTSIISHINRHSDSLVAVDPLFVEVYRRSVAIAEESHGAFDPTVGPLVELWGFGLSKRATVDSSKVDSTRAYIGYQQTGLKKDMFFMPKGFRIDFNAIAQGFTVDLIARYFEDHGIENYFVEVGGETRARGNNINGRVWRIGIDKPTDDIEDEEERLKAIVEVNNRALATSGNYRKYWVDETTGLKYAHTINPATAYPAKNRLLSATIVANSCMDADAYATVCMVLGTSKSIEFITSKPELEAYLIYSNEDGEWEVFATEGMKKMLVDF
jgi:thiamine biosynthesis lipoprotein